MRSYIALVHKDPDSDYGVSFPDFPGCITAGSTLQEAHEMAQEALHFHMAGMLKDGERIPEPSSIEQIRLDPDNSGEVALLVVAPAPSSRTVRVTLTVPEDALAMIDSYAEANGQSRSGLMVAATRQVIQAGR